MVLDGDDGRRLAVIGQAEPSDRAIAAAYSSTGSSWRDGPAIVYTRMAEVLVARLGGLMRGAQVIDIGAGTGVASTAARRAGADRVIALDVAMGMLSVDADRRPPAVVGDATRLPFANGSFDVVLAAFCLNHLSDPTAGLVEAARVLRTGGSIAASSYAAGDHHPVKGVVETVLRAHGWQPEPWQIDMYLRRTPLLATTESCAAVTDAAGLAARIERVDVDFPDLEPHHLVAWRLGMAQHAHFLAGLPSRQRAAIELEALGELSESCPPLVRSMMVITAER